MTTIVTAILFLYALAEAFRCIEAPYCSADPGSGSRFVIVAGSFVGVAVTLALAAAIFVRAVGRSASRQQGVREARRR